MNNIQLILYNDKNKTLDTMKKISYGMFSDDDRLTEINECISEIITIAQQMGFNGNLWNDYLAYLIVYNENPFSFSCEKKGYTEGSINKAALHDYAILRKIFNTDLMQYDRDNGTCLSMLLDFSNNNEDAGYFNKRIRDAIVNIAEELAAVNTDEEFLQLVCSFYGKYGVGKFGMFKAFRLEENAVEETDRKSVV